MSPEWKSLILWASPTTIDDDLRGAMLRSIELLAIDVGVILLSSKIGFTCGGPIAAGTLALMSAQFGACERHNIEKRHGWRARWSLKEQFLPKAEDEHGEEHH